MTKNYQIFYNIKGGNKILKSVTMNNKEYSPGITDAEKSVDSLRGRPLLGAGGGAAEGVTS